MPLASERLRRSQASWTASSASLSEPSIRYATARSCGLLVSNRSASQSCSFTGHIPSSRSVDMETNETEPM